MVLIEDDSYSLGWPSADGGSRITFNKPGGDTFSRLGTTLQAAGARAQQLNNQQQQGGFDLGAWLSANGGGGGGGSQGVDHFFDVNPLDQAKFDFEKDAFNTTRQDNLGQNEFDNAFKTTQFNWQKAQDDRDYALAVGDLDLARQKQASADYWEGKSLEVEQAMNSADNAANIQQAQIGAQAQIQQAQISAQAQIFASKQRLQEGLANAQNDAERIKVQLASEREIAQIAKMEDDTKRAIAAQQAQIEGFGAETTRAGVMGDLALKNNQFIMDNATNPRNLFGLYFMQRGITPDWDSLAAGNAPTMGDPLTVRDPMKAYVPTVAMPTNFKLDGGPAYGGVGTYTGGVNLTANPYMDMGMVSEGSSGGGFTGGGMPTGGFSGGGYSAPPPISMGSPPVVPNTPTDINPGGQQGGVPLSGLKPGMNLSTYGAGGSNKGSDFTMPAYYDQGKTRAVGANDDLTPGMQVWVDYGGQKMADGGYTTEKEFMVGDSASPNPMEGGAMPEIVENPTGAPIKVNPNPMNQADFGTPPPPQGGGNDMAMLLIKAIQENPQLATALVQLMAAMPEDGGMGAGGAPMPPQGMPQEMPRFANGTMNMRTMNAVRGGANTLNSGGGGVTSSMPGMIYQASAPQRVRGATPNEITATQNFRNSSVGTQATDMYKTAKADYGLAPTQNWNNMPAISRRMPAPMPQQPMQYGNDQRLNQMPMQPTQDINRMPAPSTGWNGVMQNPGMQSSTREQMQRQKMMQWQQMMQQRMQQRPAFAGGRPGIRRFALGTDVSQQYADQGMGNLYLQSSGNPYLAGQDLPSKMKMLADYGVPISPSLATSATGGIAPTLNTSAAFQQRGGGVLPSLQTFGKQTKGETENFRGYAEGVVGMPWADVVDYLGKPTANLQQARRAGGFV